MYLNIYRIGYKIINKNRMEGSGIIMLHKKKRTSISFRIILIIVVLIFPMNIYMLYSAKRSQEIIIEHTVTSMKNIANLYVSELESRVKSINNFISYLEQRDPNFSEVCKAEQRDYYYIAGLGLRAAMEEHMSTYNDADAYFFYSENMQHGMLVETSDELDKTQLEEMLFPTEDFLHKGRWDIFTKQNTKWLVHVNYWKNTYIGAGIQLDSVENFIQENMENTTIKAYIDKEEKAEVSDDVLSVTKQCAHQNVFLHMQVDRREVIKNLPFVQRLGYRIAIITLIIIPIMILVIRHLVLKPLSTLNHALNRLKTDSSTRIQGIASTEDFDYVYRSFNTMADEIVELKIDNYENQLERNKAELRNLQLQVKPHFLFNSLNLMYNLIQMEEYKSVQTMLLYFSDYFRYINVGERDFSLFQEEYELIVKYLEVSQIRYADIIDAKYEIDDDVKQIQIPQLLIHNFVENVIKHGIALTRKNHILLKAYIEGSTAVFVIQDDGIGMPKEQAENINKGIFEYADGAVHLGLQNSYRRLQNYYGDQAGMHIESDTGKGTCVTIRIPIGENILL